RVAEDVVGLAAYTMDSHNCRRFVRDGRVWNEGDVQVAGFPPYPISYRSIVPRRGECENLLIPVCLSASHIAYGSIRMEPVFMILGQSAAIAAALALDLGCALQDLPYAELRPQLEQAGQVLAWEELADERSEVV
ncbi:MAG: FAD-dependent oxidoreductase, partial [Chloroflexota bacterium]